MAQKNDTTGQGLFAFEVLVIAGVAGGFYKSWAVAALVFFVLLGFLGFAKLRVVFAVLAAAAWAAFAAKVAIDAWNSTPAAIVAAPAAFLVTLGLHLTAYEGVFGSTGLEAFDRAKPEPPDAETEDRPERSPVWRKPMSVSAGKGWTGVINYRDVDDVETTRMITVSTVDMAYRVPLILAYCHNRKDIRHFRFDRVLEVADKDGVVLDKAQFFAKTLGVRWTV